MIELLKMVSLVEYITESEKNAKQNGFAILKPGFSDIKEEFEALLEDNGWNILDVKKVKLTLNKSKSLYDCHKKKDFYNDLTKYMSSDYSYIYSLYKDTGNAIDDLKKIKDIARKKWGKNEMENCMHSSDSMDNVKRESDICFK